MNKYDENSEKQELITKKLKTLYNSVEEEEVPDRFIKMLEQLDEAERAASNDRQDTNHGE